MAPSRLEFKKFAAFIKVDGQELECHALSVDKEKNHVSCWIASEVGKNFSFQLEKPLNAICKASIFMDGTQIRLSRLEPKKSALSWTYLQLTETTGRPFTFSPLNVTDEDTGVNGAVSGSQLMQNVGMIEMEIYRALRHKVSELKSNKKVASKKEHPVLQIPEVLAKGKVLHQVGFGEETEIKHLLKEAGAKPESQSKYTYKYDTKEMLAKFTFRYRPLDVLQRAGIAPRDPTPPSAGFEPIDTPTPIPRSPSVAAPAQSHSIKRRLSAVDIKAEEAEVKAELMDNDDEYTQREKVLLAELEKLRNERAVKKESIPDNPPRKKVKKEHRPFFTPGEMIDLT